MPTSLPQEIPTTRRLIQSDLQWLVCPVCRGNLTLGEFELQDGAGNVTDQAISCLSCTRIYPVADNLPILLADRALSPK